MVGIRKGKERIPTVFPRKKSPSLWRGSTWPAEMVSASFMSVRRAVWYGFDRREDSYDESEKYLVSEQETNLESTSNNFGIEITTLTQAAYREKK